MTKEYDGNEFDVFKLVKSGFKLVESWEKVYRQYSNGEIDLGREIFRGAIVFASQIIKDYSSNKEDFLSFLPPLYRAVAYGFIEAYKDQPWDVVVDLLCSMAKELGKDENGEYKRAGDVVKGLMKRFFKEKFFG